MLFTQPIFAVFFLACFALRWSLPGFQRQKVFLLICNALFYGAWDYRFLALMAGYIAFNHVLALALHGTADERRRRLLIGLAVAGNLGVLGFFKYFGFFVASGAALFARLGLPFAAPALAIVLPVGISFISFQALSYVIDVYRRELVPARLLDFALFKSFFPQLVAGPIVRASDFLPQLERPPRLADVAFRQCLTLFLIGYFKKACVADNIAGLIDPIYADPAAYGAGAILLAVCGYSIQIYCDFSGYTDMAIAVAGLLGFRLIKNFDAPYLSTSIRDFWRRWHISLSSWLRDYLYIPLGGGRGGPWSRYRNLIVTMVLGGLWHGANVTFVLWGLGHGLALALNRVWDDAPRLRRWLPLPSWPPIGWALTLAWVVIAFALFRSESVSRFGLLMQRLLTWRGEGAALDPRLWWLFLLLAVGHAGIRFARPQLARMHQATPAPLYAFGLGVAAALALFFTPVASAPFIYFQF
jgi:alginate O-acetyltransferase complex protein AlgI